MKRSIRIYFLFAALILVPVFNRCGYPSYSSSQPDNSNSRDWNVEMMRHAVPSHDVTISINNEAVLVVSFFDYPRNFTSVYRGKSVLVVTSYQQATATYVVEVTIPGVPFKRFEFTE